MKALLSCQFAAASHCASPGSTPPVKSMLSASSLLALTQSPLLCQGQTPPSRRKCVQGNHLCCKERLGSSRLGVLSACLQLNETKAYCARDWSLCRKPVAVSATSVFCVSISHTSKKLGMNWEVWKGGQIAMKKE